MRKDGSRCIGFTLIELLVVIAIIAILAAILFPVFTQARAKAYQATCLSNMRNVSLAAYQYAQDYDEKFMFHVTPCGSEARADKPPDPWDPLMNPDWYMSIQPYVRNYGVFDCPAIDKFDTWKAHCFPTQRGRYPTGFIVDYGFSEAIFLYPNLFHLASILRPSNAITGGDNENTFHCPWSLTKDGIPRRLAFANGVDWRIISCGCPAQIIRPDRADDITRHQGGSVLMFADGHAKWERWQNMKTSRIPGGKYDLICPDVIGRTIPSYGWQKWPRYSPGTIAGVCRP